MIAPLEIRFEAIGVAAPKGSTRSFVVTPKGGGKPRAVTTGDNPRTKGWQALIAQCAAVHLACSRIPLAPFSVEPLVVEIWFYLPRPKYLLTKAKAGQTFYPTTKPDLDKLVRAAKDALTKVIWTDDAQVVDLLAHKRYCGPGVFPRAVITIRTIAKEDSCIPTLPLTL